MLVESLIKETVELQGFRVVAVQKTGHGLEATLAPDGRFSPCCGACGKPAAYRDTRSVRRFAMSRCGALMSICAMPRAA